MPLFLDQHEGSVPAEMVDALRQKIQAGQMDGFGAKAIDVLWSDSETFCVSEAPSAEAVHKAHEAIGIKLEGGAIRQINKIV